MLNLENPESVSTSPGLAWYALLALLLSLASTSTIAACNCKEEPLVPLGECNINLELCGCLEKLDWKYSAEAEEDVSGKTGYGSEQADPDSAINDALTQMFSDHPELASQCFPT